MKLIVGLGNPGRKYEKTRHNVGFDVVTKVMPLVAASATKVPFEAEAADGLVGAERVLLLWPQTYMNASGRSVRKALDFYKLVPDDLLVICDDLNLPSARLRMRPSGSAGGQKGLADIIGALGTDAFARLRVGIDRPPSGWEVVDYVLGKLSGDEAIDIDNATSRAAQAVVGWAREGTQHVMNHYNAAN